MTLAWKVNNKKRVALVAKYKDRRADLKKIILDGEASLDEKLVAVDKLNKLPKNSSKVRIRNRCQFTGRARGLVGKFKISRIVFRLMGHQGLIPGLTKASW